MREVHRAYQKADQQVTVEQDALKVGDCYYYNWPQQNIDIFGEIVDSEYEEDRALMARPENRFFRMVRAYSEVEPDGEFGTEHVSKLLPISRQAFEFAKKRGWRI
jgi:hypothetical protein